MKNLIYVAEILLPVLFVFLFLRVMVVSIGPAIIPLAALAFVAFVVWLWKVHLKGSNKNK